MYSDNDTVENPAFITPWTLVHFLSGFLFYVFFKYFLPKTPNWNLFIALAIIHTVYEIKHLYLSQTMRGVYWNNDSVINSLGDSMANFLGFYIAICVAPITLSTVVLSSILTTLIVIIFLQKQLG